MRCVCDQDDYGEKSGRDIPGCPGIAPSRSLWVIERCTYSRGVFCVEQHRDRLGGTSSSVVGRIFLDEFLTSTLKIPLNSGIFKGWRNF